MEMNRINENTLWTDALNKEMKKAKVAYEVQESVRAEDARKGRVSSLTGYQEIRCHVIFDVKMDFTRKARFVADGQERQHLLRCVTPV